MTQAAAFVDDLRVPVDVVVEPTETDTKTTEEVSADGALERASDAAEAGG